MSSSLVFSLYALSVLHVQRISSTNSLRSKMVQDGPRWSKMVQDQDLALHLFGVPSVNALILSGLSHLGAIMSVASVASNESCAICISIDLVRLKALVFCASRNESLASPRLFVPEVFS